MPAIKYSASPVANHSSAKGIQLSLSKFHTFLFPATKMEKGKAETNLAPLCPQREIDAMKNRTYNGVGRGWCSKHFSLAQNLYFSL